MLKKSVVLLFMGMSSVALYGQWPPVHAYKTVSDIVTKEDGKVFKSLSISDYYRSQSGSELTVTAPTSANEVITAKTGELYDSDSRSVYGLDYSKRTAERLHTLPSAKQFSTHTSIEEKNVLGHETIAGIECVMLPMTMYGRQMGTVWLDAKDDLIVKMVSTIQFVGDKAKTYRVVELSNVDLNYKPDPLLFHIPSNFSQLPGTGQ